MNEGQTLPVILEIDQSRRYLARHANNLRFRLTSRAGSVPRCILRVEAQKGLSGPASIELKNLTTQEKRIPWEPDRPGEILLTCRMVVFDEHEWPSAYVGESSLQVRRPGEPASIKVSIRANKILGSDLSNLARIEGAVPGPAPGSAAGEIEPEWRAVPLEIDQEETDRLRREYRRMVGETSSPRFACATLESDAADRPRHIQIYCGASLTFGRNGQQNDVRLVFLPENDEHAARSSVISRQQFALRVANEGVVLENLGSATYLGPGRSGDAGYEALCQGETRNLQSPFRLMAGLEGLKLQIEQCPAPEDPDFERTLEWLHRTVPSLPAPRPWVMMLDGSVAAPPRPRWDFGCIRVGRLNNAPEHEYLLLLGAVEIGSGEHCGIVIHAPGVRLRRARLMGSQGCFFLEDLAGDGTTTVDGQAVASGVVVRLGASHQIGFGPERFVWRAQGNVRSR